MTSSPADVLSDLDITTPGFFLRPDYYDVLAWLRTESPVHRCANGMWLVSTYDDVRSISSQPGRFTSRRGVLVNDPLRLAEPDDESGSLLHLDPPLHAEYRKLLNRAFTPRAVGAMETAIRGVVTDVFDGLPAGDDIDFVERVAVPVPVAVIAELLGVSGHDVVELRRWSDATIEVTDNPTDEVLAAVGELLAFLDGHVRARFEEPADDLLSLLAASVVADRPLTVDQVVMFGLTLIVAGNETTRSMLSGGTLALAEHPDQRARLAAHPASVPAAVEECLRWVTPIQAFCRNAVDDVVVGGVEGVGGVPVAAGDYLVLLYASANRDESVFGPTAGVFDVGRPPTPAHVAFGFGEHLCLGASLARLEGRLVFEELLRRYPGYEVVGQPTYSPSTLTRSLATLPVRLSG